jgi:hypothetical protein
VQGDAGGLPQRDQRKRPEKTKVIIECVHFCPSGIVFRIFYLINRSSFVDPHRERKFHISHTDMFFGLLDPDPTPSINKQKMKKNLDFYCFATYL